jgi:uncharacterized protein
MNRILATACLLFAGAASAAAQAQTSASQAPTAVQTPTNAQPPAASATPAAKPTDPAKKRDIQQLLELTGTKERMLQGIKQMTDSMRPLMVQALPAGAYRAKLVDAFFVKCQADFNVDAFMDQVVVPMYDRHFDEQDIKGLVQFYQTPLGKKFAQLQPEISTELLTAGQKLGGQLGLTTMKKVLDENPDLAKQLEEAQQQATAPAH